MLEKQDVPRKGRNGRAGAVVTEGEANTPGRTRGNRPGLAVERFFTQAGDDGYAGITWELRTAAITGENGKSIFEQKDIETPKFWSQTATNVVAQKYFRGQPGTPEREGSGHAVQVWLGHRHQSFHHPLLARVPQWWRHGFRPRELHARL
jgi:hypothetical protein